LKMKMKKTNRCLYVVIGVTILLFAGMVYAWSVLSIPIAEEFPQWSKASLSLTFTLCMMFFCLGGLVGGLLAHRILPRYYVWASSLLFLTGFSVAVKTQSIISLYIGYGLLCGFASGLAYNAVLSTVLKWFPDMKGLISGILLMGFGMGSFLIGKAYQALTPDAVGAWRNSFLILGYVIFFVMAMGGCFVRAPGKSNFTVSVADGTSNVEVNVKPLDMIKTRSFWLYFAWAVLLSAAGLVLISQASGVAREAGPGVGAGTIATVVGLISIFNGIGRIIFGKLLDHYGLNKTIMFNNALFIGSVLIVLAALLIKMFPVLVVGFIFCGLSYGGITPTNSMFINSFYGPRYYPTNFALINLNLLLASFGSTIAGSLFDASGSYLSSFIVVLLALLLGTVCSLKIEWK